MKRKGIFLLLISTLSLLAIVTTFTGCSSQPPLVKGNSEKVKLIENNLARSQPWSVIVDFLNRDKIDEEPFTNEHDSAYFAEILHNRAEYNNFKTAFVVVEFENGEKYALNAFETVDYGTVYVDCVGTGKWDSYIGSNIQLRVMGDFIVNDIALNYFQQIGTNYGITFKPNQIELNQIEDAIKKFPDVLKVPERVCWDKFVVVETGRKMQFGSLSRETSKVLEYQSCVDDYRKIQTRTKTYFEKCNAYVNKIQNVPFDKRTIDQKKEAADILVIKEGLCSDWLTLCERIKTAYPSCWKESESPIKSAKLYW